MKRLFFLVLTIILVNINSQAQQRPPQNIRRITVTSQYLLENGNKTDKYWTVYQEIYDSIGRLHTEIEYDFKDHYPHNYNWHTFNGKQLIKSDFFENEKLKIVKNYSYTRDSLVDQEIIKFVKSGDTSLYIKLSYKYNKLRQPIGVEATGINEKNAYKSKSVYDSNGNEISRSVSIKKGYSPLDSIIKLSCEPSYDSIGRLVENKVSSVKTNGIKTNISIKYKYDKENNIIEISHFNKNGKQISREERIFQPSRNRLIYIKYYNSEDHLIKWLEKRYEIYRTENRRAREIDY